MFWVQGLACFALWISYGIFQSRRSAQIRQRLLQIPRGRRAVMGAAFMLIGAAILFGALVATHATGGFTPKGMTLLAWLSIAASGLVFVHSQTMAMAMLITLVYDGVVTSKQAVPSEKRGPDAA